MSSFVHTIRVKNVPALAGLKVDDPDLVLAVSNDRRVLSSCHDHRLHNNIRLLVNHLRVDFHFSDDLALQVLFRSSTKERSSVSDTDFSDKILLLKSIHYRRKSYPDIYLAIRGGRDKMLRVVHPAHSKRMDISGAVVVFTRQYSLTRCDVDDAHLRGICWCYGVEAQVDKQVFAVGRPVRMCDRTCVPHSLPDRRLQ